ncbi:hypothetical protein TA3x_003928 [Tundrisphaera sp. TA3]|uniref:hypothetical protein n=1 Tax=Tundrisphaera sp. TA3 TaxID=3435775 RepID=UPI003EB79322
MRTAFTLFLTGLILACPFLCGAAEAVGGAHEHHGTGQPGAPAPAHCPEDADSCVCRGAVPNGDVRVPGIDAIGLPLPLGVLAGLMAHGPSHAPSHLTRDGTPAGLAAWGSPSAVRAFLQNFRC